MAYYINVYEKAVVFGGHEEGGWTFDSYTPVKILPAGSKKRAERWISRIDRLLEQMNAGKYEPESVLSRGDWLIAFIETKPGEHSPKERPTYS